MIQEDSEGEMVDAIGLKTKGKNSALSNQALVADSRKSDLLAGREEQLIGFTRWSGRAVEC